MNKEVKSILITNLIVIIFLIIFAGIVISFNNIKTNKRLNQIDKDIRKRPVIEYHYYEDTHQRINGK